jgi:hypothetical protein
MLVKMLRPSTGILRPSTGILRPRTGILKIPGKLKLYRAYLTMPMS